MNKVDYLLENSFLSMPIERQLEVKRLGPHKPKDFTYQQQESRGKKRNFQQAWLQNIEWLTVSLSKKSMFCFYCILFNGDSTWSIIGYDKLKNFLEKQKLHEATNSHIRCALKFKLFRKVNTLCQLNRAYAHTIKAHNDNVEKNRKILGKIIDTLKFCGKLDATTIRTDHDETESPDTKGLFLDMLEHAARLDTPLKAFLETATVDRNTLKSIRKDLLDSIFIVYTNAIKEHIRETNFVAIVADDTTDVSCSLQFVIVIRYVYNMKPVERFLKFVHVVERKAEELTKVLTEALSEFNIKRKLVAQSYDGAAIMSANKKSVSTLMQQHFPMAQHVFCYKHTSDLLLKKVCSSVSHARIFFANLSAFSTFFSSSCRRSDVWQEICQTVETKSNFQSRVGVVHWIFELKHTLISLFDEIIHNDSVDDTTITEAIGLVNLLNNREFLFFLNLFNDILFHVDILIGTCQETATINIEAKNDAVNSFVNAIHDIKQRIYQYEVEPEENATTNKVNLASVGEEACDVIVNNLVDRFETAVHIDLFSVIDPKRFADYKKQFPIDNYQKIIEFYDLQQEKLRNELNVLYSSDMSMVDNMYQLYELIHANDMGSVFSECKKLLEIVMTLPIRPEPENSHRTSKSIKTFLCNTMGHDRLDALCVLSIENKIISSITEFNEKVIDEFAQLKHRQTDYLYKT